MENENITPDTLPNNGGEGAVEETQGDSSTAAPQENAVEALSLNELNDLLGKQFPTKDAALKSIKDTFSFVGKKTEVNENDLRDKGYVSKSDFEKELFFRDNPAHAEHKEVLEAIAKDQGVSLAKAAENATYKKLFEASAKYNESIQNTSVMASNPRLAQVGEKMDKVKELKNIGRSDEAGAEAARLIIETLDIK